MKKLLFILFIGIGGVYAQNVADNNVSFDFIQLPTNPVDPQVNTYKIVINKLFEVSNEDSLNMYQVRLNAAQSNYDAQMEVWKQQKKAIDRQYLSTLAVWEKNNLANNTSTPQPQCPPYPPQPILEEVRQPELHDDIADQFANGKIKLEGFTAGDGGVTVTLDINPISDLKIVKTIKGSGSATKFIYECEYKLPVGVKVECPMRGVVFNTIVGNTVRKKAINTFTTTYDFQIWMLDNRESFWVDLQKEARESVMNEISAVLNDNCGFPLKKRSTEVYSVNKHKDFSYPELTEAYTTALQGYRLIVQRRDRTDAADKLYEAITIWENALKESNMADNKSRINDKITAMIHYNMAEAYLWLNQYDECEKYANLAIADDVFKFKGPAHALKNYLVERRKRWNANY